MSFFRCWSVRNILDLYIDGRLTSGAAARVQTHLKACAGCREEEEFLRPWPITDADRMVQIPEGLAESILAKLQENAAAQDTPWTLGEALRLTPAQGLSLAYCALLMVSHAAVGLDSQAYGENAAKVAEARR